MIALPAGVKVWLAAGATDMRKGLDGLAARRAGIGLRVAGRMRLTSLHKADIRFSGESVMCIAFARYGDDLQNCSSDS